MPVQKAQCARVPIWCNDIISDLREGETDPSILDALVQFDEIITNIPFHFPGWASIIEKGDPQESILLLPGANLAMKQFLNTLVAYTTDFPTLFIPTRQDKWEAELERAQVRDKRTSRESFGSFMIEHNVQSVLQSRNDEKLYMLERIANELELKAEFQSWVLPLQHPILTVDGAHCDDVLDPLPFTKSAVETLRSERGGQLAIVKSFRSNLIPHDRHCRAIVRDLGFNPGKCDEPTVTLRACLPAERSLEDIVSECTPSDRIRLCLEIASALGYLHSQQIVHGDLRAANLLIDNSGHVQFTNFGSSVDLPAHRSWRAWLPRMRYLAPEAMTGDEDDSPEKDVYAFSMLLYEMLTGQTPWSGLGVPSIASHVMRGERPLYPETTSIFHMLSREHSIWSLFERGWNQDPEIRPDMMSCEASLVEWSDKVLPLVNESSPTLEDVLQPSGILPVPSGNHAARVGECIVDITHEVEMISPVHEPHTHGGFCDIFIGMRGSIKVAMKRLRDVLIRDEAVLQTRFKKECQVWKRLKHPHILELYGVVKRAPYWYMISPFLENGDAPSWLEAHSDQRIRIVFEAAQGCLYLHSLTPRSIIHGDLKGANILIDSMGRAVIADFGLSKTINTLTSQSLKDNGTAPYMAPELLAYCKVDFDFEESTMPPTTKTRETDVFAFGRTVMELLSGQIPYHPIHGPSIWCWILNDRRPARPNTDEALRWVTDDMWYFIDSEMTCTEPDFRPTMEVVVDRLREFYEELKPSLEPISENVTDCLSSLPELSIGNPSRLETHPEPVSTPPSISPNDGVSAEGFQLRSLRQTTKRVQFADRSG